MKLVIGILGLTLASAMAIVSANAADMYRAPEGVSYKDAPAPVEPWTGPYVGINGGYAWGGNSNATGYSPVIGSYSIVGGGAVDAAFGSNGWFGGAQAGYNWQRGNLVLGIEADIHGVDIKGSATTAGPTTAREQPRLVRHGSRSRGLRRWLGSALWHGRLCRWRRPGQADRRRNNREARCDRNRLCRWRRVGICVLPVLVRQSRISICRSLAATA